ncbi:MAG: bifunctional DNA-binding transcriptional regulator/O6-methylguanine-DNA methyltransferase Ada [Cyanobacteria bacterium PR.3.49]|nr:bifunctional DNA-binding transcriptional regulator/O6-methylguanine-DNA methyltransferase Ada [Cyanobacteria bacterium PR.3.49]
MATKVETAKISSAAERVSKDPRWQSIVERDQKADGSFFYSVKTTGVYCRPSCAARLARPENVEFHNSCADARQAGFRSCKRCKPDEVSLADQNKEKIATVCRLIESSEEEPTLQELADSAGLSTYHFHRLFKSITGLTPKAYATAHRAKKMRKELERGGSITEAMFEAGFGSSSRFYEKTNAVLGMTPTDFRRGGAKIDIRFAIAQCSLGAILVAQSERGICSILLGDDADELARDLQDRFPNANLIGGDNEFEKLVAQVISFVETPGIGLDLPLDVRGTAFQQRVWQALRKIPAGTTVSYTELANRLGLPKAVRAVASACAANKIAVAIPCHRVVRNDGGLSGYRWGVERKATLIKREANA